MESAADANAETITLVDFDRILLAGIQAREREIVSQVIAPWQEDYQRVLRDIEQRHSLPEGAIGTTHQLDPERLILTPTKTTQPAQPVSGVGESTEHNG